MNRSKQLVIAAILTAVFALQNIIRVVISVIAQDQDAQNLGNGFLVTMLIIFTLMMVSAYGIWQDQKWGKILAIITLALNALPALLAVIVMGNLLPILDVGVAIIVTVLLLRRTEKTVTA